MEIGGETTSNLSPKQDLDCLNSAIINFDMMNSVLCIVDGLIQGSKQDKEQERRMDLENKPKDVNTKMKMQ